jgi:signal transduction histidine kinase/CheY-like chemotaxis protein
VGQSTALVEASARDSFLTLGTGVALSTLLGALAALFMARRIVGPITKLREAAIGMGRGQRFNAPELDVQELHDVSTTLAAADEAQARARAEHDDLLKREQAARASAEAANKAKDEFLAMLGHELRNPLGAISNAAHLLENEKLDGESARRTRAIIMRQVGHLTRLTDDLLDAARALMGKIVLRKRPVDLSAIAMQSIATLKGAQRLQNHRLIEDFQPAWVEADPVRLDQVICNLVVNAVKYTANGGTIRVTVRRDGNDAVLAVADDGIGIGPELAPHVFDLFVQGDRSLDRTEGGLGIGLTLVRRLAELHGGSVRMHSDGAGLGSEFTVRLPAIEAVAAAPGAAPIEQARSESRHILIVEDNADARDTLQMILEMDGHRVETAADGPSGLEKALALQPELALIDVGLPGMDGYEVARRIRASHGMRRPFLVALTGYGAPEDRERALEAGFDSHVVKPVDDRTLADILSSSAAAEAS